MSNFVIYAPSRSGSTVLCDLFDNHPDIKCEYEIFGRHSNGHLKHVKSKPFKAIRERHENIAPGKLYGFKVLSFQTRWFEDKHRNPNTFLETAKKLDYKLFFLTRDDILEQTCSFFIAKSRDFWNSKSDDVIEEKSHVNRITIKPHKFRQVAQNYALSRRKMKRLAAQHEGLLLEYDQDLSTPEKQQVTCDTLYSHLGLETHVLDQSKLHKKVSKGTRRSEILNYDELAEEYQKMLTEEGKFKNVYFC